MEENPIDFEEQETTLLKEAINPLRVKALRIFTRMVTAHYRRLQRYVRSLCRDEALCNDLVQDTFLTAQQQLERGVYVEIGKSWSWLCAIAKNLLMDHYREYSRSNMQLSLNHTQICDNLGWTPEGANGTALLKAFENENFTPPERRRKRISDNIGVMMATEFKALKLSEEERQLLCLRYCDDQVFREVSDSIGEPISTVMSRYYAAMKKVRKQLMALDEQGLFAKELSLAQMKAYIRKKNANAKKALQGENAREERQRDRMKKMVAYARRHSKCDDQEGVAEVVF